MKRLLSGAQAARFAQIALGHVTREFPNKLDHVLDGPEDAQTPLALHPVFFGSLDWHSCVHGYWMLARLLRRFPATPQAGDIRDLFDRQLVPAKVAGECAYLERRAARGFERPYGWAWLLKLAEELGRHESRAWAAALAPLAAIMVRRMHDFLPLATYPTRTGTHGNTAFALALTADFARASGDDALGGLLRSTAARWYGDDRQCQCWEPGGDDFLSPTLIEAECMRRLLSAGAFEAWFTEFLPDIGAGRPSALFTPAVVTDRADGKLAHLDGLNLSRAWCWRSLASVLPEGDPRRGRIADAVAAHLDAGLAHVAGDYMGEHWLATFAVLALDA